MRATGLLLAATVGLGATAAQTVDLFLPNADQQRLFAFSLGSDASATTWLVGCPTDSQSSDCRFPLGLTVTQGPKTVRYSLAYNDVTGDFNCKLEAKTSAACTATFGDAAFSTTFHNPTSTADSTSGDLASLFIPATIVANSASILTSDGSPTGSIVSNTGVSSTATKSSSGSTQTPAILSTQTPPVTSAPKLTTSTKSGSATVATTTSTGGVQQITGSSGWVVGGMAALALAAL